MNRKIFSSHKKKIIKFDKKIFYKKNYNINNVFNNVRFYISKNKKS